MTFTKEQLIAEATELRLELSRRIADGDDEEWTRPSKLKIKLMDIALAALKDSPVGYDDEKARMAWQDEVDELKMIIHHLTADNNRLCEKSQRDDDEIIDLRQRLDNVAERRG